MLPVVQNIVLVAVKRRGRQGEDCDAWEIRGVETNVGFVFEENLAEWLNTLGRDGWRVMAATADRVFISRVIIPEMEAPQDASSPSRFKGLGDSE